MPTSTQGSDLSENAPGADSIENRPQQGLQHTPQPLQQPVIPALPRAAQERHPCPQPCSSDWGVLWGGTTPTFFLNSFYFAHKYSLNQRQHKQPHSLVTSTFARNKSLVFSPCSSEYLGGRKGVEKHKGKKKQKIQCSKEQNQGSSQIKP